MCLAVSEPKRGSRKQGYESLCVGLAKDHVWILPESGCKHSRHILFFCLALKSLQEV